MMTTTSYLFAPDSFRRPHSSGLRNPLPSGIQNALERLRNTMESIPPDVMAERRVAWEALRRATPVLPRPEGIRRSL